MPISILKDAPSYVSTERSKQWDTIKHLLKWPKFGTLTPPNADEDVEQKYCHYCCWECKMVQSLGRQFSDFFQKQTYSYDPAIVLPGISQSCWKFMSTQNLHTDTYSSFIYNCQNLKTTKMFFSRWMYKQTMVHIDNEILGWPKSLFGIFYKNFHFHFHQ